MEQEHGDWAFFQHGPRDGTDEELAQRRLAIGPHHQQAGPQAANLLQNHLGRLGSRLQRDGNRLDLVVIEELPVCST